MKKVHYCLENLIKLEELDQVIDQLKSSLVILIYNYN